MKTTSNKDVLNGLKEQELRSHENAREADHQPIQSAVQNSILVATAPISEWVVEIKKVWRRGAASTMDLARVVCAVRTQSRYGQWAQLWKSGSLPFSKRKGDVLVAIGRRWGTADEQTYARLPIGWNILYHLARLEPTLFDRLLEEGTIRPAMTLREAKELLARFQGGKSARSQKTKIKEYLRRLARFIASRRDWQTEERELVIEALTR